ncbi:MAG: lysophospholipid acyltransferase family protein [Eubacteriales bacterium]
MKLILIDIDDTITEETEFLTKYAPNFLKEKFNLSGEISNESGYDLVEKYGLVSQLIAKNVPETVALQQANKINQMFWNTYFLKYMFYPLKSDSKEIIDYFHKHDYLIYFVSLRGKKTTKQENFRQKITRTLIVPFLTFCQLKCNRIKFSKIIMVENEQEKGIVLEKLKPRIFFDDSIKVIESLEDTGTTKIVCVTAPHNRQHDFSKNVLRLNFTSEEIAINSRSLRIKEKFVAPNTTKLRIIKKFTNFNYYFYRILTKKYFTKRLKPLVFDDFNVRSTTCSIVYYSNHRNVKDPIVFFTQLKTPTHFMALKRMFEFGDNMFGDGCVFGAQLTTYFVKVLGALPIARTTDLNFLSTTLTTLKKSHILIENRASMVIFPEGTINRNPEQDGQLLKFKSNKVFELVHQGKALAVPTAISWVPSNYNLEHSVIIRFMEPIDTSFLTVNEIKEICNNAIEIGLLENEKLIENMKSNSRK